ncbi:type II toxin-antitoxin system death-on-curing family toxin [Morganella morganii]|uniref:type II toxin-antitoxin system death-on-curing family toxin n=1 Tax=Morganella morganii TaxID=582 RepID=UPI0013CCC48A|nr:type II toxin-antitoxin system death-on-curing family toxin [Morganella morganii]MBC6657018.1 type II toxin-antitoxin system death-on-curing family toxin [Morganella morganii]MDF5911349.1 type II toxin-antitoxin system death-on-curing family toxin [Morganella morganii]NGE94687.1 type II toxin-antitoxin system death-on-curing family toxin [Morganella morganii]HCR4427785.1 type II toxin-antitoxin system death-on-curing family toxin [Morganella morganii]HCT1398511.1 type II toxin-antitoxin sys
MTIRFLTVDEVVEIQRSTLPNSGKPDLSKLEVALSRIEALRDYEECEDIFKFSAMYLISIAKAHAFNDANKRTAFQAASVFLILNGVELNVSMELVKLTILAATGEAERDTAAFVLKVLSDYHNDLLEETTGGY